MKRTLIFCLVLMHAFSLMAQIKPVGNCNAEDVYIFSKGDTVRINCDTVYAMTNFRYHAYETMRLTLVKNKDLLFSTITELKSAYEKRLEQQRNEYLTLKCLYDSLDAKSTVYIKSIDGNIKTSLNRIQSANSGIDSTRQLLKETKDILKSDINRQLGGKLLWCAGGVVIGLGISVAVFFIAGH
ncbi:MAG: hypothetical protein WCK34_04980 [Bacteroidota bacterium]